MLLGVGLDLQITCAELRMFAQVSQISTKTVSPSNIREQTAATMLSARLLPPSSPLCS